MWRKLCALFLLAVAIGVLGRSWYVAKDGFSVNRIRYVLPLRDSDPAKERQAASFLDDGYHYLGRGRQCYAFISPDGSKVLKIPRFDRYALPFFWKAMPSFCDSIKRTIANEHHQRMVFTLESFRIAAEELPEETALIYLHLHRTRDLPKRFHLYDRLHRPYEIDLNRTAFALQEKKTLMMPVFLEALRAHDRAKTEQMLAAFLDVLQARAEKSIFNRDPSFLKNFGWDGKKSIQIDVGSFWKRSELPFNDAYRGSLIDGTGRMREWLAKVDPESLPFFDERLRAMIGP